MSIPGSASPLFIGAAADAAAAYQIDRSLRFNSADSAYLNRTPSSAGNRKTWTWSGWVKRSELGVNQSIFGTRTGSSDADILDLFFANGNYGTTKDALTIGRYSFYDFITNALFRDVSAWYHIVLAYDTTQATASNRIKLYVNGNEQTFSSVTYPALNADLPINKAAEHEIGGTDPTNYLNGYLTEVHFVDGQALAATDFGEYDSDNNWNPKAYSGSYGTNGFYLKFADNSSNAALGTDSSGNSNTWTVNNITANAGALQSQTWSNNITTTGNSGTWHGSFPATNAFNANDSNYAHANGDGSVSAVVTLSISPAISCNSSVTFLGGVTSSGSGTISINGGTATAFTTSGTNPTAANTVTVSFSGDITSIVVSKTSTGGQGLLVYGFKIDGARLVDSGVAYTAAGDTDSLIDTPTNYTADFGNNGGNYATWNPLDVKTTIALSNGNLDLVGSSDGRTRATLAMPSGKWYWEITVGAVPASNHVGVWATNVALSNDTYRVIYRGDGYWIVGGSVAQQWSSVATGDIVGITFDADTRETKFYKNGTLLGTKTAPALPSGSAYTPAVILSGSNSSLQANFGQRSFIYPPGSSGGPSSDYKSLCTTNLPDPTIADSSDHFDTKLYTGNGSTQSISGYDFSPDLVWIKNRSYSSSHELYDTVRGATKRLTIYYGSEQTVSGVTAFNSNGFSLGSDNGANRNSDSLVAWAWGAGASTVSNTDGSITTNVRTNPSAGFSIINYQGNGTSGATIGHNLNSAPEWLMFKTTNAGYDWYVYHKAVGHTKFLTLNNNHVANTSNFLNNTAPTSSVITLGNVGDVNYNNTDLICYAWTSVAGYSSFGSYTGNGSADGPLVALSFRPAFLLLKRTNTTGDWLIYDNRREGYNFNNDFLYANLTNVEGTTNYLDLLSNGFKLRTTNSAVNGSSDTYIYAAFAEHSFSLNGGLAR